MHLCVCVCVFVCALMIFESPGLSSLRQGAKRRPDRMLESDGFIIIKNLTTLALPHKIRQKNYYLNWGGGVTKVSFAEK